MSTQEIMLNKIKTNLRFRLSSVGKTKNKGTDAGEDVGLEKKGNLICWWFAGSDIPTLYSVWRIIKTLKVYRLYNPDTLLIEFT